MQANRQLLFPASNLQAGYNHICDPTNSLLRWLHLGRLWLPTGSQQWMHSTGEFEETLVVLHGSGHVMVHENEQDYDLGTRHSPFSDPPTMLYIPPDCTYTVIPDPTGIDLLLTAAPAQASNSTHTPLLFPAEQVAQTYHGTGRWKRKIYLGTVGDYPIERLMVGETLNVPGGWTSFPPHKHDTRAAPQEMPYEEIYFFLLQPDTGFAIQRVYDAPEHPQPLHETLLVHTGDTVVIPHGYHPVVGGPGYQMYYVWVMCGELGEARIYGQNTLDPDHAWLQNGEVASAEQ